MIFYAAFKNARNIHWQLHVSVARILLQFCGSMHETNKPQTWKNWDNAICVLGDQVSITSQIGNMLGSAYSEVLVTAPCSNSFLCSTFCAWNP
jgi:hypothetical protein